MQGSTSKPQVLEALGIMSYQQMYRGPIGTAMVYDGGNIPIESGDAVGAVFAPNAMVLVDGKAPSAYERIMPDFDGSKQFWLWEEYQPGLRKTQGQFIRKLTRDASEPTA